MEDIGENLRQAREQLGLTLEEAERATRIRARHLAALEAGDLDSLPSSVQARGFLKNYAEFLGLDADALLLRYAEGLQSRRTRPRSAETPQSPRTQPVRVRSRRPRWLSSDLFVAASVMFAAMVIVIWGLGRVLAAVRGEDDVSAPSVAEAPTATLAPSPAPADTQPPASPGELVSPLVTDALPSATLPPLNLPGAGVSLRLLVISSAWVQVAVDGQVQFRGRARPGDLLEYVGEEVIEVITGNGAGLRAYYNGQDQGTLGDLGEVVIRLWTKEGVITPTPTETRTPTRTPRVTPTPLSTPGAGT